MYVRLSNGLWEIYSKPFKGLTVKGKIIVLNDGCRTDTKDYMDTVIHETIHASRGDLSEKEVSTLAGDIIEVLWAMGCRLPH